MAGRALEEAPRTALDLGAGSGIVGALMAAAGVEVVGIERDAAWAEAWATTLRSPALRGRLRLVVAEVGSWAEGPYDAVVANPPWFRDDQGPASPLPRRSGARTAEAAMLSRFHDAARRAVAPTGCIWFVIPAARRGDLPDADVCVLIGARIALLGWGGPRRGSFAASESDPLVQGWVARARGGRPASSGRG